MGIFTAKARKDLSADALFKRLRADFDEVPDKRRRPSSAPRVWKSTIAMPLSRIPTKCNVQYFSWITDWPLTPDTVYDVMRGGRARGKIENETFNTLKNQGYNLEHNDGHGDKTLPVVLASLMMLAFLVDQTQQAC